MPGRFVLFVLLAGLVPVISPGAAPEANEAALVANLKWRSIGPANMGGRVTDIAGLPGDPYTFYVGGADGGIFKTTNGGTTFEALFQDQAVLSIGAIAIAPSDPNVIWVGTGEGDPRNSASFGNGVYRSTDAGKTWKHLGLGDTERISASASTRAIPTRPTSPRSATPGGRTRSAGCSRQLLRGVTDENLHGELDTGPAVGREACPSAHPSSSNLLRFA